MANYWIKQSTWDVSWRYGINVTGTRLFSALHRMKRYLFYIARICKGLFGLHPFIPNLRVRVDCNVVQDTQILWRKCLLKKKLFIILFNWILSCTYIN